MSLRQRSHSGAREQSAISQSAISRNAATESAAKASAATVARPLSAGYSRTGRTNTVQTSRAPQSSVPAGKPSQQNFSPEQPSIPSATPASSLQPAAAAPSNGDYRSVLLAKKQEVLTGMGMKFDAASKLGRVAEDDAVQIAHDEFINLRLNAIGWDQVRLMDEALDRLQTGEFGICMRCDEPISARRLAVVPWAKYCVKCQEKLAAREPLQEESLQEAYPNHLR